MEPHPEPRIDPLATQIGPKLAKHLVSAHHALAGAGLPAGLLELVSVRASQINGCSGCLDMHTTEARAAGETEQRLHLVAAWRDATVFTDVERAALELTEQGCRLADGGRVTDEAWVEAARLLDREQLVALVGQIAVINAFNRLNVMTRQLGGSYGAGAAAAHPVSSAA